jgi:hypothetical protein
MTLCRLVNLYRSLKGSHCLQLQDAGLLYHENEGTLILSGFGKYLRVGMAPYPGKCESSSPQLQEGQIRHSTLFVGYFPKDNRFNLQ